MPHRSYVLMYCNAIAATFNAAFPTLNDFICVLVIIAERSKMKCENNLRQGQHIFKQHLLALVLTAQNHVNMRNGDDKNAIRLPVITTTAPQVGINVRTTNL